MHNRNAHPLFALLYRVGMTYNGYHDDDPYGVWHSLEWRTEEDLIYVRLYHNGGWEYRPNLNVHQFRYRSRIDREEELNDFLQGTLLGDVLFKYKLQLLHDQL